MRLLLLATVAIALPACKASAPRADIHSSAVQTRVPEIPRAVQTARAQMGEPAQMRMAAPKVIRRIVAEERDLVRRSQALAAEVPDPSGRKRATEEVDALAAELAGVAAPLDEAFRADRELDSDALDAMIDKLLLLDTRISLVHEKLRSATERTTAVLIDR